MVKQTFFKKMTLGEICDSYKGIIKTGPFGSQLHQSDYIEEGTPVIMPKNIIDWKVDVTGIAKIGEDDVNRLSQHKTKIGDIVYGRRGAIGRHAYITENENGWICGTGCIKIRIDNSCLEPKYLSYYLRQDSIIKFIYNQAIGATMPNLNSEIIRSIPIILLEKSQQKKIVAVLSAYDDLIDNNTRRIKILEEMAQLIYREWFVHFRFPGHEKVKMVETELGMIPEGWKICIIGDTCIKLNSGGTPSRNEQAYWSNGSIPWFKTKELNDGFLFTSEEYINRLGLEKSSAKLFPEGTVLMAIYAAPTVGRLGILTSPAAFNQATCGMVANPDRLTTMFLFYKLLELRNYFNMIAQGAAQQNISVQKVREALIVLPPIELINRFDSYVLPLMDLARVLSQKNTNLRQTRDLLLPKLISGEIDVENLDIAVPEEE